MSILELTNSSATNQPWNTKYQYSENWRYTNTNTTNVIQLQLCESQTEENDIPFQGSLRPSVYFALIWLHLARLWQLTFGSKLYVIEVLYLRFQQLGARKHN